jgi:hypothetical protein
MDLLFRLPINFPNVGLPKYADARQDSWSDLISGALVSESTSAVILKGNSIARIPSSAAVAAWKRHDVFAVIIPLPRRQRIPVRYF